MLLALVAGLAGALAFPLVLPGLARAPMLDAWPRELGIFLCAGALYALTFSTRSRREVALLGAMAGAVFFAVLIFWLDVAMTEFGRMPRWQSVPVVSLLIVYCAAYWALLPVLARGLTSLAWVPPSCAFALAVVLTEWLRSVMLTGFPWGLLGYSQARNLPLAQAASLAGVFGVSFLVALLAALGVDYLRARHTPQALKRGLGLTAITAVVYAYGLVRLTDDGGAGQAVRVALLQGNIDQHTKNRSQLHRERILGTYTALTQDAARAGAEVAIWPEAAWPGALDVALERLPRSLPLPVLIGASTYTPGPPRRAHNSAFWIEADGRVAGRYDKLHLVPFGEYVPLRGILPVEKVVPGLLDYSPGTSAAPLAAQRWGVLICYDGIFPEISRAHVRAGAELLANLTNDAWYGVSSAPYQHRDFYTLRAIETDRWVARATNTGVSAFFDPRGRVREPTQLGAQGMSIHEVQRRTSTTLYVLLGDWLVLVALAVAGAALLERFAARRRRDAGALNTDRGA